MARKATNALHDATSHHFRMPVPPSSEGTCNRFTLIMGIAESSDAKCENEEGEVVGRLHEETIGDEIERT